MNSKSLSYLLQNPSRIDREQISALEQLIEEFPYFQAARSILLKGLKDQGSFLYNKALKTTAAYTTDRRVLFEFITSSDFIASNPNTQSSIVEKKQSPHDIKVKDVKTVDSQESLSMDEAVAMNITEAEEVLNPELFATKDTENNAANKEMILEKENPPALSSEQSKTPVIHLHPDEPLAFTKKETHSFTEWLKLTSLHPIDRDDKTALKKERSSNKKEATGSIDKKSSEKQQKFDIIDQFIASNPKIKPVDKSTPTRNIAKEHTPAPDELMTETLARVYLSQKNYKKAIQAYKILILKNPEKSGFFADQIRAIKKLQENK